MNLRAPIRRVMAIVTRWPSVVPTVVAFAVLGFGFVTGIRVGLAGAEAPMAPAMFGIAAVISSKVHGLRGYPYRGFSVVHDVILIPFNEATKEGTTVDDDADEIGRNFRDSALLNSALRDASSVDACGSELVFDVNNDQGIVDYIRAAFLIFGINVAALYNFYYVLRADPRRC